MREAIRFHVDGPRRAEFDIPEPHLYSTYVEVPGSRHNASRTLKYGIGTPSLRSRLVRTSGSASRFADGLGEADLSDVAGLGVFKRWLDNPGEFDQVSVDAQSRTIVWPGGLDVAPDRLYDEVAQSTGKARPTPRGKSGA